MLLPRCGQFSAWLFQTQYEGETINELYIYFCRLYEIEGSKVAGCLHFEEMTYTMTLRVEACIASQSTDGWFFMFYARARIKFNKIVVEEMGFFVASFAAQRRKKNVSLEEV